MAVYTRSRLLKSKKVIIIQSDFGALERLPVGKYVSQMRGEGAERNVWKADGRGTEGMLGCRVTWWVDSGAQR